MTPSKLQQELKKKHPFDCLEQEAALNVVRTNDQLQIRFSRLFREHGVTPSQYNILRILRGAGERLPILEIAQRTVTVVPGITGLIDRLEQAGFVVRNRCLEDRRVIFISLTELGSNTVAVLDQPVLDLHRKLFSHLSPTELQTLSRLLELAREGLEAQPLE
jgi:MarR family 2-MHQ and catechol resistance regulon transcriptional repressor